MFSEMAELIPGSIHINFTFISIIITFISASHSVITNIMQIGIRRFYAGSLEDYITFFSVCEMWRTRECVRKSYCKVK